jgi:hypothetical protein
MTIGKGDTGTGGNRQLRKEAKYEQRSEERSELIRKYVNNLADK